jgi:hypothetical protein
VTHRVLAAGANALSLDTSNKLNHTTNFGSYFLKKNQSNLLPKKSHKRELVKVHQKQNLHTGFKSWRIP